MNYSNNSRDEQFDILNNNKSTGIFKDEVKNALKHMKPSKTPGKYIITTETINH